MTNDVPTKLVAVMLTTHNYYYKPPVPKSKSKNILVEKKGNKPTDAQPIKNTINKIVQRKEKNMASTSTICGTHTFSTIKASRFGFQQWFLSWYSS
jgi:hypothetical protein